MSEAPVTEGVGGLAVAKAELGLPGRVLSVIAGGMILLMMVVTTVDVCGRYFFNRPLFGAFETIETLMGLVIFAGMPLATAAREHIVVNFLEALLGPRGKAVQAGLFDLACAAVAGVMAWRIFLRGAALINAREVTLQLAIPRGYIAYAMSALLALTSVVFVWAAAVAFRRS